VTHPAPIVSSAPTSDIIKRETQVTLFIDLILILCALTSHGASSPCHEDEAMLFDGDANAWVCVPYDNITWYTDESGQLNWFYTDWRTHV
jgi:hypothetical protein